MTVGGDLVLRADDPSSDPRLKKYARRAGFAGKRIERHGDHFLVWRDVEKLATIMTPARQRPVVGDLNANARVS
jgi:hypothetical protein